MIFLDYWFISFQRYYKFSSVVLGNNTSIGSMYTYRIITVKKVISLNI